MKKKLIIITGASLLALTAFAAFKCRFCNGTGWRGDFQCNFCKGTGAQP